MTSTTSTPCSPNSTERREGRRDSLGRRIGYNWWREFIWTEWRCAYDAWYMAMHEETLLYESEAREYRHNHPSPKFKDFLIQHAGQHTRKD